MVVMNILFAFTLLWSSILPPLVQNVKEQPGAARIPKESDFYELISIPSPEGVVLEVGGMDFLPDGRLAVCTRRGDIYVIKNPGAANPADASFTLYASGLHEPLGLLADGSDILCVQRGEMTRVIDTNRDGVADRYETECDTWAITGNYHEYAYGPKRDRNGDLWVTLNLSWTDAGRALVPWRGLAAKMDYKTKKLIAVCAGLRSPAGVGMNSEGDMFYTDNQGDWNGTCSLRHLEPGWFMGHPESLKWWNVTFGNKAPKPPAPKEGKPMHEIADEMPDLKLQLPAVWFPYPRMGQSSSDILCDTTGGKFGPFQNQLFVGDQTTSEIFRVVLEKVNNKYQGAAIPFRSGFSCGILRMCFDGSGVMYTGETNRGWGSRGPLEFGVERLRWKGTVPFEIFDVKAAPEGFILSFTQPATAASIEKLESWKGTCFTYQYHESYGSDEMQKEGVVIKSARAVDGGRKVHIAIDGFKRGFVYAIHPAGVRSASGDPLLHPVFYYTLNFIPR